MTTYKELQRELEKLHQQAERARLSEKSAVLEQIKSLIIEYRLMPSDLGLTSRASRKVGASAAKFRDPNTGATWSGRGRPPKWLEGQDKAKFTID